MLLEIRIRNFAIIDEVALEFAPGLNVLSGETGAGKTIILSALGLLLGERASADMIRAGQKEATVEARFEIDGEMALPEGVSAVANGKAREVIMRRTVSESGRSRISVGDALASASTLARMGALLVQIYGQHEQQSLMRAESHREILDRFSALDLEISEYRGMYDRAIALRARIRDSEVRERERADLLELARFRAMEIDRAAMVEGEDDALLTERTRLANAAKLGAAASQAEQTLYGGDNSAIDIVSSAQSTLEQAASLDASLGEPLEMIRAARANLTEAARALGNYAEKIEADPARLEQVEARLAELGRLKRKYGGSIASALEALARARDEIKEHETASQS